MYEGVLFFGYTPPDILDAVKDFEVRDSDIYLATYPKAGMKTFLTFIYYNAVTFFPGLYIT